ncbi:hypothetical protein FOA52_008401 [Chlamydomonas sp. UWO 241]|nr:hypothetical protein FOA52_008401 [Chlamydomonas sp. UWO 241]
MAGGEDDEEEEEEQEDQDGLQALADAAVAYGRSQGEPSVSQGGEPEGAKRQRGSSRYIGVCWNEAKSAWRVRVMDPVTKSRRHIGRYASEEDAARAYDCAAVQAHGPDAKRNFPDEAISELPAILGEQRKQRSSSRFVGVCWNKAHSSWLASLWDPQTKRQRHIGYFASEEDAARAYDCAAVHVLGAGTRRNFPDEAISEMPVTLGVEQKQRSSSRFIGVSWNKANSSWHVRLTDPQTKRSRSVGNFTSEEDAARAYDCAVVQVRGPSAKRNFPDEPISELPVLVGEKRKQRGSSRFVGVSWSKSSSVWHVKLTDPITKRSRHIGCFVDEVDAAKAYDRAAVLARGPGAKRNFPDAAPITELPATVGGKS